MSDQERKNADDLIAENVMDVLTNGPGLRIGRNTPVLARDPSGFVLLGGLGAMGVGQMWVTEDERHRDYPGYQFAPTSTRRCEGFVPGDMFRGCDLPYGHDMPHHAAEVFKPERTWVSM